MQSNKDYGMNIPVFGEYSDYFDAFAEYMEAGLGDEWEIVGFNADGWPV
jgi:hypothetical protein